MIRRCSVLFLGLVLAGCRSEDPRLPEQLYEQATQLSRENKNLEARALLERLAQRFPESRAGQDAVRDLHTIEAILKQEMAETQRRLRSSLQRTAGALERYKAKTGEYPWTLQDLVPEYLDQVPETPWGHPFLYRAFVRTPLEELRDRRGRITQRFNTRRDGYHLISLGTDLRPGGEDLAADFFYVNGDPHREKTLPPIPLPQPVR